MGFFNQHRRARDEGQRIEDYRDDGRASLPGEPDTQNLCRRAHSLGGVSLARA